jgi:hypothetical protein
MTTDPDKSAAAVAVPEPVETQNEIRPRSQPASGLKHWLAVGTGVGVEVREHDLHVCVARVRPRSVRVAGAAVIADFRNRPAAEWGAELAAFLRKSGAGHVALTVLLPRRETIVRQVQLPGVADRDLGAAIQLQIDSLHPFADDEIYYSWARLGSSPTVLVGIARRDVLDGYFTLFAEAGLKVASITYSAAVLYAASRVITAPPAGFVVAHELNGEVEVYGESESRAAYSATLPVMPDRAVSIARSELRLEADAPVLKLSELLPQPSEADAEATLAYAAAVAGACGWMGIDGNLLPADRRRGTSRIRLIPTVTLGTALAVLAILLAFQSRWADTRYLGVLQHEIGRYEPRARRVDAIDRTTTAVRARSQMLDEFKRRARLDMDALAETTKLLPPPGWVSNLDMDRTALQIAGETEGAAELLRKFDGSPLFERTEFTMPISRVQTGEAFRIRTQRQTPPLVAPAVSAAPPPIAGPGAAAPVSAGGAK